MTSRSHWISPVALFVSVHPSNTMALNECEHEKHALEVCPVCGHKYGSDWQREELPQEVIDMIKSW